MLYSLTKCLVRLGLLIYCRKIIFDPERSLNEEGPLLLACSHPNSFLDALIIGSYFKRPVHFLARGDAFKNALSKKILTALHVIPIYRLSEGKEYLGLNDTTFERCTEILRKGGIVLIFSEGLCLNQWKVRPLKKGTARIALKAWKQPAITNSFCILPVSLNYSSFTDFRKRVIVSFGLAIQKGDILVEKTEGEQIAALNKVIFSRLEKGLIIEENDKSTIAFLLSNFLSSYNKGLIQILKEKQSVIKQNFVEHLAKLKGTKKVAFTITQRVTDLLLILTLAIPSLIGLIIHLPLHIPLKNFIRKKTKGTVFYHSALFGTLLISYPAYALMISVILALVYKKLLFLLCILIMPVLAYTFLVWKDCVEGVLNSYIISSRAKRSLSKVIL